MQLKRNLLLTLDWNLPDLALSEIFQRDDDMKYSIQNDLFDKALLGKKLEPFVDLFLDREFALHRYLKSDKLVSLFNEAKDREFLTTTSLEGILGLTGVCRIRILAKVTSARVLGRRRNAERFRRTRP